MVVKKIEMRPEDGNYNDILYPKTSTDMVVDDQGNTVKFSLEQLMNMIGTLASDLTNHKNDGNNPNGVTKSQVGLGNVTNDKQMPINGGQFAGVVKAQSNTSYATPQIRNITISTGSPTGGQNGDLWFKYV